MLLAVNSPTVRFICLKKEATQRKLLRLNLKRISADLSYLSQKKFKLCPEGMDIGYYDQRHLNMSDFPSKILVISQIVEQIIVSGL